MCVCLDEHVLNKLPETNRPGAHLYYVLRRAFVFFALAHPFGPHVGSTSKKTFNLGIESSRDCSLPNLARPCLLPLGRINKFGYKTNHKRAPTPAPVLVFKKQPIAWTFDKA